MIFCSTIAYFFFSIKYSYTKDCVTVMVVVEGSSFVRGREGRVDVWRLFEGSSEVGETKEWNESILEALVVSCILLTDGIYIGSCTAFLLNTVRVYSTQ